MAESDMSEMTDRTNTATEGSSIFSGRAIKAAIHEHGFTLTQVAHEAGVSPSEISAALAGRIYLGAQRRQRIEAALLRLGIDPTMAREPTPLKPGEFRIRHL